MEKRKLRQKTWVILRVIKHINAKNAHTQHECAINDVEMKEVGIKEVGIKNVQKANRRYPIGVSPEL